MGRGQSKTIDGGRSSDVLSMYKYKSAKCENCKKYIIIKPYYGDMEKRYCKSCRKGFLTPIKTKD